MSVRSDAHAVMIQIGCGKVMSEGMCEGQYFCTRHGSANDVGWGWDEQRGCLFVYDLMSAVTNSNVTRVAQLLDWAR